MYIRSSFYDLCSPCETAKSSPAAGGTKRIIASPSLQPVAGIFRQLMLKPILEVEGIARIRGMPWVHSID